MSDVLAAAALLEQHPDSYRVLRRLVPSSEGWSRLADEAKVGLYVDCETTGLDTATAKVIEFGAVPFTYTDAGIVAVGEAYSAFEDPGEPLSDEVKAKTGISDEMLRGQRIDDGRVKELIDEAVLVIAHHALFDRPILERRFPAFIDTFWACSYREVDWQRYGCACSKLEHILAHSCGAFYDAHRAADDCYAGLHALRYAMNDGQPAFTELLLSARQTTLRVHADGAPFAVKDDLKLRGYHWNADGKVWFIDIRSAERETEVTWLAHHAHCLFPSFSKFGARDRYSVRAA